MSNELCIDGRDLDDYDGDEWDDYRRGDRYDEAYDGDLCRCGRQTLGEECSECGEPLCPMCFETGAGFCSNCPTEAYADIYEERMRAEGFA